MQRIFNENTSTFVFSTRNVYLYYNYENQTSYIGK